MTFARERCSFYLPNMVRCHIRIRVVKNREELKKRTMRSRKEKKNRCEIDQTDVKKCCKRRLTRIRIRLKYIVLKRECSVLGWSRYR